MPDILWHNTTVEQCSKFAQVGNHEVRKKLIWCEEEKKKKNPHKFGVLLRKQNEKIQGMYGIGHSGSEMMDHCPKLKNKGK